MRLRILPDPEALAEAAADEVANHLRPAGGDLGLAGGSTPRRAYERLAARDLPWERVDAWMTDERHVPRQHPECNAAMVRRALFDHVPGRLHEPPVHLDAPAAAAAYAATLAAVLPRGPRGIEPSLVILGIGEDGHTASLFPGSAALDTTGDYAAVEVPAHGWRLTATIGLLARARHTIFLVSGPRKAEVLAAVLAPGSMLPAARVALAAPDPLWLVDREAAGRLKSARE